MHYKKGVMHHRDYATRRKGASLVTRQRKDVIVRALERALPLADACALADISEATVNRARRKSPALDLELRHAEAVAVRDMTSIIYEAARRGIWQAAAWINERRWPNSWAKVERQEVSGPGGAPLAITSASQDEYIKAVRRALGFRDEPHEARTTVSATKIPQAALPQGATGDNGTNAVAGLPRLVDQ